VTSGTAYTAAAGARGGERNEPPFPSALVEEMLKALIKAVRANQLYLRNNPMYARAIETLRAAFKPIWERAEELSLACTETTLRWHDRVVLEEREKSADSLPWLFFKDGIRELRFLPAVEDAEVVRLLDLIQRARKATPDEDDLLTMLWEQDFVHLRYTFVDLSLESASPLEAEVPEPENTDETRRAVQEMRQQAETAPGVVSLEDFDTTLYFLDEKEIDYLREAVSREYAGDLRRNVVSILLDVLEQQTNPKVRDEICEILETFLLHLLSAGHLSAVALLLREAADAARRGKDLSPAHRDRLVALPEKLSAGDALAQLIESLDAAEELPAQGDLAQLFEQLRPSALAPVFTWLGQLQNAKLRPLLESAAARLASLNTTELVKLITSKNAVVALEAIQRAGGLKTAAAVPPLGTVMEEGSAQLRLAGVQALAEIGSPSAMVILERAVADSDRDVRVATVRALAARTYKQALPRVEGAIKSKQLREADVTEKMAFFEAYGALCGDAGVKPLDELLNGKGFLGRRGDPELRACAAMALGRIGSPRAAEALRRAASENEKEVLVRNAVNRALRGGQA
jgi:HEAT repeat protein